MTKKHKSYKSADLFFAKLRKDPEVMLHYEAEKARTQIAALVKNARQQAGLTQAELARKVGTSQSVIARLETGADQRTPSLTLLARIAAALDAHLQFGFKFAS
jgi:DNA-binding XRE family transcriptional regulator